MLRGSLCTWVLMVAVLTEHKGVKVLTEHKGVKVLTEHKGVNGGGAH